MTAPNTPADDTTPQAPADAPQPQPAEPPADNEPEPNQNSEAARWRVKLRQAEAERDALAEKVTAYQRRAAEAVVADVLAQPGDLWEIGRADVSEFVDDEGNVNEDEIRSAAAALLDMRPGLAKGSDAPKTFNWGQHSSGMPAEPVGWASVIGRG